jgi:hypothetical protein
MWDRIYVGPTFQSVIEFMWDRLSSRSLRECHCVSTGWKAGPTDSHRGLRTAYRLMAGFQAWGLRRAGFVQCAGMC